jgi:hypothetical protein
VGEGVGEHGHADRQSTPARGPQFGPWTAAPARGAPPAAAPGLLASTAVRPRIAWRLGLLVVVGGAMGSDGSCAEPDPAARSVVDSDGDGLSDVDERTIYGTSPVLADTDGDGISDRDEIVGHAFDPEDAPTRYNPLVADVPEIGLRFTSKPVVTMAVTDAEGNVHTFDTSRSTTDGVTSNWGTSDTQGQSDTTGWSSGQNWQESSSSTDSSTLGSSTAVGQHFPAPSPAADAGAGDAGAADAGASDAGADGGATTVDAGCEPDAGASDGGPGGCAPAGGGAASGGARTGAPDVTITDTGSSTDDVSDTYTYTDGANVGDNASTTGSISYTYSEGEARANAQTLAEAQAVSSSGTVTKIGGSIKITAVISSEGHLAFQVGDILLAATIRTGGVLSPLGNLTIDAPLYTTYPPFSLGPGDSTPPLTFSRGDLSVSTVTRLLENATGVDIRLALLELRDRDGHPFAFQGDDVLAKTAEIVLDFGAKRGRESYRVATNAVPEQRGVPLARALRDILRVPIEVDDRGLARVCGVGGDGARSVVGRRRTTADRTLENKRFDPDVEPIDPEALLILAGDAVRVALVSP